MDFQRFVEKRNRQVLIQLVLLALIGFVLGTLDSLTHTWMWEIVGIPLSAWVAWKYLDQ